MKDLYLHIALALFLLAGCWSCIDVIDLETDEATEVLIIEGAVYNNGSRPEVRIRQSAAFSKGPEGVQNPVSGAQVSISEVGGDELILTEVESGIYRGGRSFGNTGKEYQLTVAVNGRQYRSLIEKMPARVPVERLSWTTRTENTNNAAGNQILQKVHILMADALLPEAAGGTFLRYRVFGTYEFRERTTSSNLSPSFCYIEETIDLNNLALIDGREIRDGRLIEQPILETVLDFRFAFKYCFTVVQQAISNNAYNYWRSVNNEFERTGDIFEAPPARIKGNIFNSEATANDVIGLFSAIATDTAKILVNGLDLDGPRDPCNIFGRPLPEGCLNCLVFNNSSLIKPECFQ